MRKGGGGGNGLVPVLVEVDDLGEILRNLVGSLVEENQVLLAGVIVEGENQSGLILRNRHEAPDVLDLVNGKKGEILGLRN